MATIPYDDFFRAEPDAEPSRPASAEYHEREVAELNQELARPGLTAANKKILQEELAASQGKVGRAPREGKKTIPYDQFFAEQKPAMIANASEGGADDKHLSMAQKLLSRASNFTKSLIPNKNDIGSAAALGDMVLGLPAAVVNLAAQGLSTGMSWFDPTVDQHTAAKAAAAMGKAAEETSYLPRNPLEKLMTHLGYGDLYANSEVAKALTWFNTKVSEGGGSLSRATKGVLSPEEVGIMVDGLMTSMGSGVMRRGLQKAAETVGRTKPLEPPEGATTDPKVIQQYRQTTTDPNTPAGMANIHSAAEMKSVQDWINENTGVARGLEDYTAERAKALPKEKAVEAQREAIREAQRKDARAAFKDDADYVDYLRRNMEIRASETGTVEAKPRFKLRLKDAKALPDDPTLAERIAESEKPLDLSPEALSAELPKGSAERPFDPADIAAGSNFAENTGRGRGRSQAGGADLKALTTIAAAGLGITTGAWIDKENPFTGGLLGLAIGVGLAKSGATQSLYRKIRQATAPDPRTRINDLLHEREGLEFEGNRQAMQFSQKFSRAVPDGNERVRISQALEEGWVDELSPKSRQQAKSLQDFYKKVTKEDPKNAARAAAIYNNRVWNPYRTQDANINALLGKTERRIELKEGKAAGLTPLTEDAAVLAQTYGTIYSRLRANQALLDKIKTKTIPGTKTPLAASSAKAPDGYYPIAGTGLSFHPDVARSFKFLLEAQEPNAVWAALGAANMAIKRASVSNSLFHAKSLFDAGMAAAPILSGIPFRVAAQTALPRVFGENKFLKMGREGKAGDNYDYAGKSGLEMSMQTVETASQDINAGPLWNTLRKVENSLDSAIPYSGKATVGVLREINQRIDRFMWQGLHTALKGEVFLATAETLFKNNAKQGKPISREKAGEIAANFTNFAFGGINWGRFAESFTTRRGRDFALEMLSPRGRRALNQVVFALDWTLATNGNFVRAVTNDIRPGMLRGVFQPTTLGDLHRQALIKGLVWYYIMGDAVQFAMTGTYLHNNKDKTRVKIGDGLEIQLSKHLNEPLEILHKFMDPEKSVMQVPLNKMAQVPKEALAQTFNQKYPSVKRAPPMVPQDTPMSENIRIRLAHAANTAVTPISADAFTKQGLSGGVMGFLGMPIYGETPEQARTRRMEAALKAYRERVGQP